MSETTFELVQPSAVQALERAAVDAQIATARAYPRDLLQFKKRSLAMATLDLETAKSCIYQRPVGKDENGRPKIAEGESIRMAEIVAASFGNLRVGARVIEQTPTFVRAEGVAHDLESNYAGKSEVVESTVDRKGRPYSERQRTVVAKAALAKAYRDAIFKVVPRSMCKFIRTAAEQIVRKEDLPLDERRKKLAAWAKAEGLAESRICAAFGVKAISELQLDHFVELVGIWTAIKEGDTNIDEAFPDQGPPPPTPPGQPPPPPTAAAPAPSPDEKAEADAGLAPTQQQTATATATENLGISLGDFLSRNGIDWETFQAYGRKQGWKAPWDNVDGFEALGVAAMEATEGFWTVRERIAKQIGKARAEGRV
jgi:hypothetical protein